MTRMRINRCLISYVFLLIFVFLLSFSPHVHSQTPDPALIPLLTEVIYSRLSNLSTVFEKDVGDKLGFCIKDVQREWNETFDFSSDTSFLAACLGKTQDLTQRICTAAEVKFYFGSFFESGSTNNKSKFDKNCNLTSWNPGCEPGWACSADPSEQVDLKNSVDTPTRTRECQTCCEGFFCPRGITCMIPCPLGAHCPLAKLNQYTGVCDPYSYQLPPGNPNHTCGGADVWSDIRSSRQFFCSAGSYCPTTTREVPCSSGYYSFLKDKQIYCRLDDIAARC